MNANSIAKSYSSLTPEERFRLVLAAGARGDDTEQERLRHASKRITLSMPDYSPWSHAFGELAMMVFLEILEEVAKHHDAFERWCDADEVPSSDDDTEPGLAEDKQDPAATLAENDEPACVGVASANHDDRLMASHMLNLYLAQGFILKTKIDGWKMFCERLSIPAFTLWQLMPGFERLQLTLQLMQDSQLRSAPAFRPEGMLRWLSEIRPRGKPEPTIKDLMSPERFADDLDRGFRERVKWWGE